jgi:short-subunit dehydrogenase
MLQSLAGANAILTGGSQGIGPFIARALASEGVNIALVARTEEKLRDVALEVQRSGQRTVWVAADLTAPDAAGDIVARCEEQLGPIDILINNAGLENGGRFAAKTAGELDQVLLTNLRAPLMLTRQVLPGMIDRKRGHIITIASLAGKMALPYAATYSASKAALMAWSASLRVELLGTGVGCTAVTPGFISDAGMFASHKTTAPKFLGQSKPDAVAQAVIRALKEDPHEIVVSARPVKPLQLLYTLSPQLLIKAMGKVGLFDFLRRNFEDQPH